jgi:hypothetical protein
MECVAPTRKLADRIVAKDFDTALTTLTVSGTAGWLVSISWFW